MALLQRRKGKLSQIILLLIAIRIKGLQSLIYNFTTAIIRCGHRTDSWTRCGQEVAVQLSTCPVPYLVWELCFGQGDLRAHPTNYSQFSNLKVLLGSISETFCPGCWLQSRMPSAQCCHVVTTLAAYIAKEPSLQHFARELLIL